MATVTPVPLLTPEEQALADLDRAQVTKSLTDTLEHLRKTEARTRTKSGKIRHAKFLAGVLALRFEGKGPAETAKILGVDVSRVYRALTLVRSDAAIEKLLDRVDQVILPLAIDNAAKGVMNGDKDYSLEMLRGRGILRTHKSIDAQVKQTILTLEVRLTEPDHLKGREMPMPRIGSIVGAPVAAVGNAQLPPAADLEGVVTRREAVQAGPPAIDVSKAG